MNLMLISASTNGETDFVECWEAKEDVDVCEEVSDDDRKSWMMRS